MSAVLATLVVAGGAIIAMYFSTSFSIDGESTGNAVDRPGWCDHSHQPRRVKR